MKVFITGASSFVGSWLCRTFSIYGPKPIGLCSMPPIAYEGLKKKRLEMATGAGAKLYYMLRAEDGSMARWIESLPLEITKNSVWVHHHHHMNDYRTDAYDINYAIHVGVDPLPDLVRALKKAEFGKVIFSGSYFEIGERGFTCPPSPYAESKSLVWHYLSSLCEKEKLTLGKIVIPDVVGPMENEDRLIPTLIRCAKFEKGFNLRNPSEVAEHMPVKNLARHYIRMAGGLSNSIVRPTAFKIINQDWVSFIIRQLIQARLNLKSPLPHIKTYPVMGPEWLDFLDEYSYYVKTTWRELQ